MRFPPDFLDSIRARLPVSSVVGKRVKLKKAGREWKGLSPFKAEKTPSFTVNDQKAIWHDFSAGEGGDVFKFVMLTEGLSFPEAVERLAGAAGVPMPTTTPEEIEREAHKLTLIEVVDVAQQHFSKALRKSSPALAYLNARGIDQAAIDKFDLGFAPDDARWLLRQLPGEAVPLAIEAGLLTKTDDGETIDRFRNRAIFPIQDGKGRIVGFGGRDLGGNHPAKYLNTAETPIFDKGHLLYNAHRAREPAWNEEPLIVVEGYAGTIASDAAGFPATVATMGTALTPFQLETIWRMSDCPILAYDGDEAGQKASRRAIEAAMPILLPGRSMKIARLPAGLDPDDVVRKSGAEAFRKIVGAAARMVDALWAFETAGRDLASPDDRAAIEARLLEAVKPIPSVPLRRQYEKEYRNRINAIPMRRTRPTRSNGTSLHSISPGNITLAHSPKPGGMNLRAAMLILAVLRSPATALAQADALSSKSIEDDAGDVIRRALDVLAELPDATADALTEALQAKGMGDVLTTARDLCHKAGIHSLDASANETIATALLTRH